MYRKIVFPLHLVKQVAVERKKALKTTETSFSGSIVFLFLSGHHQPPTKQVSLKEQHQYLLCTNQQHTLTNRSKQLPQPLLQELS